MRIKSPSPPPIIQEEIPIRIVEQKPFQPSIITNEYDEDFSEVSHSPQNIPTTKIQIENIDIESIHDDIEDKPTIHDTNQSSTSKSSADEQSEILVIGKISANTTPRQQDDKNLEEELPPPPPFLISIPPKIELDDTLHDISDDDERIEQETKVDKLTETLIRTFIDEAIDQGKEIENKKLKIPITPEASEWMSDEDLTDEENKQIPVTHEEDIE
jgi:hypothetical protein